MGVGLGDSKGACSSVRLEASAGLLGASVLWGPPVSACVGGAESAGHYGPLGFVAVGATCVVEGFQGAFVG